MPQARPDWYPDPDSTDQQRWWDGQQWSTYTRPTLPAPPIAPPPAPSPESRFSPGHIFGPPQAPQPLTPVVRQLTQLNLTLSIAFAGIFIYFLLVSVFAKHVHIPTALNDSFWLLLPIQLWNIVLTRRYLLPGRYPNWSWNRRRWQALLRIQASWLPQIHTIIRIIFALMLAAIFFHIVTTIIEQTANPNFLANNNQSQQLTVLVHNQQINQATAQLQLAFELAFAYISLIINTIALSKRYLLSPVAMSANPDASG